MINETDNFFGNTSCNYFNLFFPRRVPDKSIFTVPRYKMSSAKSSSSRNQISKKDFVKKKPHKEDGHWEGK
jgi:hypothetical protein